MAATPAKPKPKFPNAKTYKDAKGNIREVGTGRLIRAAPKPAAPKKPKTFIDGQGVVRRVGTAANGRPAIAVNPLDRQVDGAILAQTAPLNNRVGDTNAQFGADQSAITNAGTALNSELQALQDRIAGLGAQQLGAAASASGGTAEQQTASMDYLRGILGSNMSDGGSSLTGAASALAAAAQGEGAGAVANIALGERGAQNDLGTMGGASALQRQSTVEERMRARDAALRDYKDQIAAIKANRTAVKNDLVNTSLDQQAARQQIRLAQAEFDRTGDQIAFDQAMAEAGLALDAEQIAQAGAAAGAESAGSKGVYGFGEQYDAAINGEIQKWRKLADGKSYGKLVTWLVRGAALSPAQAVQVATRTVGVPGIKKEGVRPILNVLRNQGISKAVQKNIITNVFGKKVADAFFGGEYGYGGGVLAPGNANMGSPPKVGEAINGWKVNKVQHTATGGYVITVKKGDKTKKVTVKLGESIASALYRALG